MRSVPNSWAIILLILIGFAFRVGLILFLPGSYNGQPDRQDAYLYDSLALNILHGYGYSVNRASVLSLGNCPPCEPIFYPTPGYALFLAALYFLIGKSYFAVKFVQALIDIATVCIASQLAIDVTGNQRIARFTLALAAVFPLTAVWVTDLQTETFATFFATLSVWLALRAALSRGRINTVWFAIVAGLGILIRASFLLLPVALLSTFWLVRFESWKESLIRSCAVLSIIALVLIPWITRNYLVSGKILFANKTYAPEQDHVWGYYAWYLTWLRDPTWTPLVNWDYVIHPRQSIPEEPFPDYAYDSDAERRQVESLIQQVKSNDRFTEEVDKQFGAIANAKASSSPVRQYLILPTIRVIRAWISSGTSAFNLPELKQRPSLQLIRDNPLPFLARSLLTVAQVGIALLGFVGIWLLRRHLLVILPLVLSIVYHTLVMEASGMGVQPRYLVYSYPTMLIFASASLAMLFEFAGQLPILLTRWEVLRAGFHS